MVRHISNGVVLGGRAAFRSSGDLFAGVSGEVGDESVRGAGSGRPACEPPRKPSCEPPARAAPSGVSPRAQVPREPPRASPA